MHRRQHKRSNRVELGRLGEVSGVWFEGSATVNGSDKKKAMRRLVIAAAAFETLLWLGVTIWFSRTRPAFDLSGLHGTMLFLVFPAVLLAAANRWLPLAAGLLGATAFMWLSVLVAGRISS